MEPAIALRGPRVACLVGRLSSNVRPQRNADEKPEVHQERACQDQDREQPALEVSQIAWVGGKCGGLE
jgi:hypothetical protein